MRAQWVESPYPAWAGIETRMTDDSGVAIPKGDYVGVYDDTVMAGAFLVKQWTMFCWEIHGGVSKEYWGSGPEVCREAGEFLFRNTQCIKIVAVIPDFNKLMCKCVEKAGMVKQGLLTKSFMKGMRMRDQIIYGAERNEVIRWREQ